MANDQINDPSSTRTARDITLYLLINNVWFRLVVSTVIKNFYWFRLVQPELRIEIAIPVGKLVLYEVSNRDKLRFL